MSLVQIVTIISLQTIQVIAIWPPSYNVSFYDSETFVISEELTDDDTADIYEAEDEMIQKEQLKAINYKEDKAKFFRLHQLAIRNNKEKNTVKRRSKVIKESNYEEEDPKPWIAGVVDKNGNYIQKQNMFYFNESAKNSAQEKFNQKREEIIKVINITNQKNENYDYTNMKADYEQDVQRAKNSNNTLNYTDVKEDETLQDTVKEMVNFDEKPNCTREESSGIGIAAAKCLWKDVRQPISNGKKQRFFEKILRIIIIWFFVYLIIAIPCWCQRGWCCCCFYCRYCRPHERIDEAKQFLMDNPAGVFHTEEGEEIAYTPSTYERYMQKRLEKVLMQL